MNNNGKQNKNGKNPFDGVKLEKQVQNSSHEISRCESFSQSIFGISRDVSETLCFHVAGEGKIHFAMTAFSCRREVLSVDGLFSGILESLLMLSTT